MLRIHELKLPLDHPEPELRQAILRRLNLAAEALISFTVFKRAHDARKTSAIQLIYTIDAEMSDEAAVLNHFARDPHIVPSPDTSYRFVARAPSETARSAARPIIVGMGPCGLFAGLILAQMGFKPIILERGKIVRERTADTFRFWRKGILDPESNAQFGEGGAGTFSDGKLYSQVKDPRHLGRKVLTEFVDAGAPAEILYASKPHIGTFRLVSMIERMRKKMEALGAEIRFGSRVTDILISQRRDEKHIAGVVLSNGETLESDQVVMALGHSARDSFEMLYARGVFFEPKPFSIGVRIEHPQSVIDAARFGPSAGHPVLGAADYKLAHHASNGRSVYSFCMCPGGTVVAAASEQGRLVTNGMSQYSRIERNANAGIVVGVNPDDFPGDFRTDALAGIAFQRHWEEQAYLAGGSNWNAPGQTVGDFLARRPSTALGSVIPSYKPGVTPTDLGLCLPTYAVDAIREALPAFGHQISGFSMDDAVMTGVETRTSSPVRMTRGKDLQSLSVRGFYPAGEGAGYAGGILSASIDGIKVAEALALNTSSDTNAQSRLLIALPSIASTEN
ncbi:MAG: NAD(P)/FAD-dependent oxidoreductase [Alphaproteobacteria bacterium]|nr:NAD(P)/FAD-dependent oxidoreductase [Alphaproteobacteria bacterium]